ncbi:unnamed protein product [Peniophora sp. CBMAI 1063]|nr:unnamed protein product [Peniophora sp. CBMAI 1063]
MRRVTDITDLPVELLQHIFASLPDQSLTGRSNDLGWLVAAHVCRLWRNIALSKNGRAVKMELRPDRAQQDVQALFHELFSPLPVTLIVEEYRLDLTRASALHHHWTNTLQLLSLLTKRVHAVYVRLRQHTSRLQDERIEELLALVLAEPTLETLIVGQYSGWIGRTERGLKLSPVPELQGGGLRVLRFERCRLQEQAEFLSTQSLLEEFCTEVHGPLRPFLLGLCTANLNRLDLTVNPWGDDLGRSGPEGSIEMPALFELSLRVTVKDALTFMHAVHLPSLVSLKFDFPVIDVSGIEQSTSLLVDWLSSRFGDIPGCTQVNILVTATELCVNMSWSTPSNRATHRKLNVSFPRLPSGGPPHLTRSVEECGMFLSCLFEKFAAVGTTHVVSITAGPPTFAHHGPSPHLALLKEIVLKYINKLYRTTNLQLGWHAALMLLPLQPGPLPHLSELRIGASELESTAYQLHEDQLASLRSLVRGEADSRGVRCRVELDGVDLPVHTSVPEPASAARDLSVDANLMEREASVLL